MARQLSRGHSLTNPNTATSKTKKLTKISKVSKPPVKKIAKKATIKSLKMQAPKATKVSKKKPIKKSSTPKNNIKKVVASKEKGVPASIKGYTPDQYAKYLSQKKRLQTFSNQQLKDMLKKNLQSMSGNKDQLILKIADGAALGRIPRCPKCFGGRPKFDYKKGTYHCSGYRDDQDFKNCHTDFKLDQIKRQPWE